MPMFDLILHFVPAFHRPSSLRVEGEVTSTAMFEAPPSGLLPRIALTLDVDAERTAELYTCSQKMLQGWEKRWAQPGLDGISVEGTFETSDEPERSFSIWSPPMNSLAHSLVAAALSCLPPQRCNGVPGALLEIVRSHFGLQPAVVVVSDNPLRLRLAPWLHRTHATEVDRAFRSIPADRELIIDASGMERFGIAIANILPMPEILRRAQAVRWVARQDAAKALLAYGVAPSAVETALPSPLTSTGHPVILGGVVVASADLISLAKEGAKLELTRRLRQEYKLTVAQASQAALELLDSIKASQIACDGSLE